MKYDFSIKINNKEISIISPTYFIADIGSNHDGDIKRAKNLIRLAKKAGADAVKFQHFIAEKIVSDFGFKSINQQMSHQAKWKDTVFNIYKKYECSRAWTEELLQVASQVNIDFLTTPYDFEALELFKFHVPAFKIGSGDITWLEFIEAISKIGKPVLLSTGASTIEDVKRAVDCIISHNKQIALMQCNTNYTGSYNNFNFVNLKVLKTYSNMYPNMVLGFSDHTPGFTAVLGAVSFGARIIEKHFTDDINREGPDHSFALDPYAWEKMVKATREFEIAMGNGIKKVEENEKDTFIIQRRCIRLKRSLNKGEIISLDDLEILRPAPLGSIPPFEINNVIGKTLLKNKEKGDALFYLDLEEMKC